MRYQFKEFEFNSQNLVLTKAGEAIDIRHNEAKVLALMLENTEKVLSKEEILSRIWQDKVVSDQAVFQNISHLRNLFGNDAIKTYPKRGYQWQLAIKTSSDTSESEIKQTISSQNNNDSTHSKKSLSWLYPALAGVVLVVALVFTLQDNRLKNQQKTFEIAYIPFTSSNGVSEIKVKADPQLKFSQLADISTNRFFTSHQQEYRALAETNKYVLAGQFRIFNQQTHLDFLLKGPFSDWTGQLSASTTEEVLTRLNEHLKHPVIYDLLSKQQSPELKQANLSIAHQQAPNDLIILSHLVDSYIEIDELDKAMVIADKLVDMADLQENVQYHGNALLDQSEILTKKDLFDLSSQKLFLAIEYFEKINDLKRQADALGKQSWLDHQRRDYPAIKASLLKSAQLALDAKDIPRELHALTYLSVMAKKYDQNEDKYLYLQQAENKMREYQLPTYHYAKIPFHHAIYTDNPSAKEPHLKRVLEYTRLNPDYWVAQSSRYQLLKHYIAQGRISEAESLVQSVQSDNAQNSFLKTLLAKAKDDEKSFLRHAQRTFEQAQLAGYKALSLDVALMLCDHPNATVNYDFYSQYIQENATKYWRTANETKLIALNL